MATSDQAQKSIDVPQHKRLAMGVPLDGTKMQPKGSANTISNPKGGLAQAKKK